VAENFTKADVDKSRNRDDIASTYFITKYMSYSDVALAILVGMDLLTYVQCKLAYVASGNEVTE